VLVLPGSSAWLAEQQEAALQQQQQGDAGKSSTSSSSIFAGASNELPSLPLLLRLRHKQ
jgi:hypothetical protein